jgi:hypothetical protein
MSSAVNFTNICFLRFLFLIVKLSYFVTRENNSKATKWTRLKGKKRGKMSIIDRKRLVGLRFPF